MSSLIIYSTNAQWFNTEYYDNRNFRQREIFLYTKTTQLEKLETCITRRALQQKLNLLPGNLQSIQTNSNSSEAIRFDSIRVLFCSGRDFIFLNRSNTSHCLATAYVVTTSIFANLKIKIKGGMFKKPLTTYDLSPGRCKSW